MPEPAQKDDLTQYKFRQLFDGLSRLETTMQDGFAEIKRLLDARLESRDKDIRDLDDRVTHLEQWRARIQGQLVIIGAAGGVVLTLATGTVWMVFTQ